MTILHTILGPRIVVAINGDLDLKTAKPLRDALDQLIDRYPDKNLLLDLAEVDFVDSSGIGVILGRYRKLAERHRTVSLAGVKPALRTVLDLAGIFSIIAMVDSPVRKEAEQ
jgi:stage II sporulation protein AA (anti-sigma F factor antagonist)